MTKPRLLLIEDDAALQTLLVDILAFAGYEVAVAMTYNYRFVMQEVNPAILVLGCDGDYTFARGWEIATALHQQHPDLVMIMLSTNRSTVGEVGRTPRGRMFSAGIIKPFVIDELLQTIAKSYERSRGKAA